MDLYARILGNCTDPVISTSSPSEKKEEPPAPPKCVCQKLEIWDFKTSLEEIDGKVKEGCDKCRVLHKGILKYLEPGDPDWADVVVQATSSGRYLKVTCEGSPPLSLNLEFFTVDSRSFLPPLFLLTTKRTILGLQEHWSGEVRV